MSRLPLLILIITELMRVRTAVVSDNLSISNKLEKLYQKLDSLTFAPPQAEEQISLSDVEAKIDKLNALYPEKIEEDDVFLDEDEELLKALAMWGVDSPDQLGGLAKELQEIRFEGEDGRSESEYSEDGWSDYDYAMDGEEWAEVDGSTLRPQLHVTPQPLLKLEAPVTRSTLSAIDAIAATNERPRILEVQPSEKSVVRREAIASLVVSLRTGRCLTPQPRWLTVRQLAPASDTIYMPPCVQLHRCAADTGCCHEGVCAPVEGKYVALPFYLTKTGSAMVATRMLFFNHTKCDCVTNDMLLGKKKSESAEKREPEIEWVSPTQEPKIVMDEEPTAPPQMRRCTCPTLFIAKMNDSGLCACVCDWPEPSRRRDCQSQSKGKEHFSLRDRVCISSGDCTTPYCENGHYWKKTGMCPWKKVRRFRYAARGRSHERSNED